MFRRVIRSIKRMLRLDACPDYSVTGNGVAHRTADSYLNDETVQKALKRMSEESTGKRIWE